MPIVIEIAPELENQIRQAAADAGVPVAAYILESVAERLRPPNIAKAVFNICPKLKQG